MRIDPSDAPTVQRRGMDKLQKLGVRCDICLGQGLHQAQCALPVVQRSQSDFSNNGWMHEKPVVV